MKGNQGGNSKDIMDSGVVGKEEGLEKKKLKAVRVQTNLMKKSIENDKVMEVLRYASNIVNELNTTMLMPRQYYELYTAVFDSLQYLVEYLRELHRAGKQHLADIYELVQYASGVVTRLYLMITVGSAYISVTSRSKRKVKVKSQEKGMKEEGEDKGVSGDEKKEKEKEQEKKKEKEGKKESKKEEKKQVEEGGEEKEKRERVPVKEVLRDMLEMSRGVQNPIKGLFLRYYLGQMTKDYLPLREKRKEVDEGGGGNEKDEDEKEEEEGEEEEEEEENEGTVDDSIHFLLANFTEMNKLWVRQQHLGLTRDKAKREEERRELRTLVGSNLHRLSSLLEGLEEAEMEEKYHKVILPSVLSQVVSCKDALAQEYLMEAVIQVFSEESHVKTMGMFVGTIGKLHPNVDVKAIVIGIGEKLSSYITKKGDNKVCEEFWEQLVKLVEYRNDLLVNDVVAIGNTALKLAIGKRGDLANKILGYVCEQLEVRQKKGEKLSGSGVLVMLLTPLRESKSAEEVFEMSNYIRLAELQSAKTRRRIRAAVLTYLMQREQKLESEEQVEKVMRVCGESAGEELETRVVHLLSSEKEYVAMVDCMLKYMRPATRDVLVAVGNRMVWMAVKHLAEPTALEYLQYIRRVVCTQLEAQGNINDAFAMCLYAGSSISNSLVENKPLENASYDFYAAAMRLYEDGQTSLNQYTALCRYISSLYSNRQLSKDSYYQLVDRCVTNAGRLLDRAMQTRALVRCSSLFYRVFTSTENDGETQYVLEEYNDTARVAELLDRAKLAAESAMDPSTVQLLLIELAYAYIYLYGVGCVTVITPLRFRTLVTQIDEMLTASTANSKPVEIELESADFSGNSKGDVLNPVFDRLLNFTRESFPTLI